jgi:hypothetical protein
MGFEAIANTANSGENKHLSMVGAAKASVAVSPPVPADADLRAIVSAWPSLPDAIKGWYPGDGTSSVCRQRRQVTAARRSWVSEEGATTETT